MPFHTRSLFTSLNYTLNFLTLCFCLQSSSSDLSSLLKSCPSFKTLLEYQPFYDLLSMPTTAMKSQCFLQSELISQSYVFLYHFFLFLSCKNNYILLLIKNFRTYLWLNYSFTVNIMSDHEKQ